MERYFIYPQYLCLVSNNFLYNNDKLHCQELKDHPILPMNNRDRSILS